MAQSSTTQPAANIEAARLEEARGKGVPWRQWGPYLSERQWGTVREDYSEDGNAWNYFTHDQARSRAYHWGEDGIAGISDDNQRLCFALALWNGKDPILKERLFGLTNSEGNHGEDVKEYYFYLDSTPTHSYMKYLYKYPQSAYPYDDLIETAGGAAATTPSTNCSTPASSTTTATSTCSSNTPRRPERYPDRISVCNRGPERRRCTSCQPCGSAIPGHGGRTRQNQLKLTMRPARRRRSRVASRARRRFSLLRRQIPLLFTENETNNERLFGTPNATPMSRTGSTTMSCQGRHDAVNPNQTGTKAAAHYRSMSAPVRPRHPLAAEPLHRRRTTRSADFDQIVAAAPARSRRVLSVRSRRRISDDAANVMRQALAGMLWSKQYFFYDVDKWLEEHGVDPHATATAAHSEPRLVPHDQRTRDLDAGQVGISVVRGLGPRLSHDRAV